MINRVVLAGRLTKDPDLRYTPQGVAVCNFTIAVNRPFKTNGEQEADFLNVVVWRRAAENTANFTNKGSLVGVDGRLQSRSFDNQEGKRVFVTEVVADSVQFLESKGSNNQNNQQIGPPPQNNQQQQKSDDPFAGNGEPIDISDDDLPF